MSRRERMTGGPWPLVTDLVRKELNAYLEAARASHVQELPTRCTPWTLRDLTAHLAMTFKRFADMLEQSRRGDLFSPFAPGELSSVNLQAVEQFQGDPLTELPHQVNRFLAAIGDPEERMAHQRGPIPVSLQLLFGLNELAVHRRDLEEARGGTYRPAIEVIRALTPVYERVLGGLPYTDDVWPAMLIHTGRAVAG